MPIIVELDMYSGLPNPAWELSESEAETLTQILSKPRQSSAQRSPAVFSKLGYRGFILTPVADTHLKSPARVFDGLYAPESAGQPSYVDDDSEVEKFLLNAGKRVVSEEEFQFATGELEKNVSGGAANSLRDFGTLREPPFDPGKWNNNLETLRRNNCYNYANDIITNTFAQPGRGSGQIGPYPPTCPGTGDAARRDGQRPLPNPDMTPAEGQIIALVVSPFPTFSDYHWYRRDDNGRWSHKPGGTPATNRDNSGNAITDPRTCDRGYYTDFCGFYHCIPTQVRIR